MRLSVPVFRLRLSERAALNLNLPLWPGWSVPVTSQAQDDRAHLVFLNGEHGVAVGLGVLSTYSSRPDRLSETATSVMGLPPTLL